MLLVYLISVSFVFVEGHDIKGFDDTVLFNIKWAGDPLEDLDLSGEHIIVTSVHEEKYKCMIPNISEKENSDVDSYKGPLPLELLSPLFSQSSCSFRMESYWTYEICHGKFIRQYHEDREGKKFKLQEYYLGRWDKNHYMKLLDEMKKEESEGKDHKIKNIKKIDGINLPYLEIQMINGTLCDLNNEPRTTKVLYVCYMHGKHEVYSLKETSTCNYEVIVLSPLLCSHPKYKPQDSGDNLINCYPLEGAPKNPRSLLEMKADSYKFRHKKPDSESHVRVEIHPIEVFGEDIVKPPPETPADLSPVQSFLSGKNCLHGGSGWWKYEFCYGKSVEQYHIEKDGSKVAINLGNFDLVKHLEWIGRNPQKRPKPVAQRKQLSHFYSGGTTCDKTGKPRQTVVKLKCLENSLNLGAVSLYLLEPKYCEYVLGVESPLICEILALADDHGLVESKLINSAEDGIIEDESDATKALCMGIVRLFMQSKMNLDSKTMDPETAKSLFFEGATLVILGVPKGTEFGIDMKVWNTDDKFRGFKMIPPGLHFVHYSAVSNTGNLAPRSGFFYNFKLAEFVVKMYDCKTEDISEETVKNAEVVKLKENLVQLDRFLGPYPYDIHEKWLSLTDHITDELMRDLVPKSGYIRSAMILMSCNDADRPRGNVIKDESQPSTSSNSLPLITNKRRRKLGSDDSGDELLPDLKPMKGTELRFTKFPELNYPEGATPAEITKHSLDSTYVLNTMLTRYKNTTYFIGEIQFAYVCFLVGHSLESFEHWKSLIGLLCSCDLAIIKHRIIYDLFTTILEPQLKEIPEEFLADIVANNNFAYVKLKQFFRTVQDSSVDGRLKTKIYRFKDHISNTYNWDFTVEDDEDDAPVVVELD